MSQGDKPADDAPLPPWVLQFFRRIVTRNGKKVFAGYGAAYFLEMIVAFKKLQKRFPTFVEMREIMGYSAKCEKNVAIVIARLRDEGYIETIPGKTQVTKVLKYPYVIKRPDYVHTSILPKHEQQ